MVVGVGKRGEGEGERGGGGGLHWGRDWNHRLSAVQDTRRRYEPLVRRPRRRRRYSHAAAGRRHFRGPTTNGVDCVVVRYWHR